MGTTTRSTWFQKYLLPGFVFQSVVIGGGYGTGRELAEFFLTNGPIGGLLSMVLVSTVIWSAVCAVTFEFARVFRAGDYRTLFTHLLGRGWILFEICYLLLLIIILAAMASGGLIVLLFLPRRRRLNSGSLRSCIAPIAASISVIRWL